MLCYETSLEVRHKWFNLMGEIIKLFPSPSLREEKEVSLLHGLQLKKFAADLNFDEKAAFCCDLSRTLPDRSDEP